MLPSPSMRPEQAELLAQQTMEQLNGSCSTDATDHIEKYATAPSSPVKKSGHSEGDPIHDATAPLSPVKKSGHSEGDPMHNDEILRSGRRLDPIRKVPSDQVLPMLRWGSTCRKSGRSKSGLQIVVPSREKPETLTISGPFTGRSIIYAYLSSSSSGGQTTRSIGAVGDHLSSSKTGLSSASTLPIPREKSPVPVPVPGRQKPSDTSTEPRTPIAELVEDSLPDSSSYKLLVTGEIGPDTRPVRSRVILPSELGLVPPRRRSLSDLHDIPPSLPSPLNLQVPHSALPLGSSSDVKSPEPEVAPVWMRAGPPLGLKYEQVYGSNAPIIPSTMEIDPLTYSLPFGSKVFMMKTSSIQNLRASVITGIWSSSNGANKVLENAWKDKKADEDIVFMFSIVQRTQHSQKFCGLATMKGPFDADAKPQSWIEGLKGCEGVIPIQWIVVKDVPYSVFNGLKHKEQPVTQLRHANTVPGETGRTFVKTYFEAEHGNDAVLHPTLHGPDMANPSPNERFPIKLHKKPKWFSPRNAIFGRRPPIQQALGPCVTPEYGRQHTYRGLETETRFHDYQTRFSPERNRNSARFPKFSR